MQLQNIKQWLRRNGYTQAHIAQSLGLSQQYVGHLFQGRTKSRMIIQWLKDHGCPERYLKAFSCVVCGVCTRHGTLLRETSTGPGAPVVEKTRKEIRADQAQVSQMRRGIHCQRAFQPDLSEMFPVADLRL